MAKKFLTVSRALMFALIFAACAFAQQIVAASVNPSLPAPGEAPPGSPVAKHGHLKRGKVGANNGALLANNGSGAPVTLRGMSLYWASSGGGVGFYSDPVIGWLVHDFGCSVVRAAIGPSSSEGGGQPGYLDGNKAGMVTAAETVIEAAIRRGIYVIVDWHTHSHGTANRNGAVEFFTNIAQKYGQYPNVLYEPYNEALENVSFGTVKDFVQPIIDAIRGQNANGPIIIGSGRWSSRPSDAVNNEPTDNANNLAYTMHFYANSSAHQEPYRTETSAAITKGLPVFVTEFGMTNPDGKTGSVNTGETDKWINYMEQNYVGWANWSVVSKTSAGDMSGELSAAIESGNAGNPSGWTLSTSGSHIRSKIRQYNDTAYSIRGANTAINVTPGQGGSVEKRVGNAVNDGPYAYGTSVTLRAVPEAGWEFDGWGRDAAGNSLELTYAVRGIPLNIGANFWKSSGIRNGTFSQNTFAWSMGTSSMGTLSSEFNEARGQRELKVVVSTPGSTPDAARFTQNNVRLNRAVNYELTFKARAAAARPVSVRLANSSGTRVYADSTLQLGTVMADYKIPFTMNDANNNTAMLTFNTGGNGATWYLDDVRLDSVGVGNVSASVRQPVRARQWSAVRVPGGVRLTGPVDAGAVAYLYDIRGRVVRSLAAKDGMTISSVPSGAYMLVVKNADGRDMFRTRALFAQ